MANDELGNRKIFASGFDFLAPRLGPNEMYKLNQALPELATAVAEAVDLYVADGRIVELAEGELRVTNTATLAEAIRTNLVRKGLRNIGTAETPVFELEYRGVQVSEANLRKLLSDENEKYGLLRLLPLLRMEDVTPRGSAPPAVEPPPEPKAPPTIDPAEIAAGKRASARYSEMGSTEKTRQERERGAEVSARHARRQGTAA
jgi:hypothetical protein